MSLSDVMANKEHATTKREEVRLPRDRTEGNDGSEVAWGTCSLYNQGVGAIVYLRVSIGPSRTARLGAFDFSPCGSRDFAASA